MTSRTGARVHAGQERADPLFIVGMPRSGTTMLSAMLNAHPDIAVAPELHYFTQYWVTCRRALQPGGIGALGLVDVLAETPHFGDMKLTAAEMERIRRAVGRPDVTHRDLYRAFLEVFGDRRAKSVVGEKTPPYLLRLPLISTVFPSARYICIIRDPRGVSLSWQRSGWRGGAAYHALLWRQYYRAARRAGQQLGRNFLLVTYEQVLGDPRTTLTRCCELVGTSFDEAMLLFHETDERNFDPQRERWKLKATTPLDPANADSWRTELPSVDIAVIERITGGLMRAAGYAASGARITADDARSQGASWAFDLARKARTSRRRRRAWGHSASESWRWPTRFRA